MADASQNHNGWNVRLGRSLVVSFALGGLDFLSPEGAGDFVVAQCSFYTR
ncbi:hypothetical protein EMIT07CA2_90026 [Brevibacillus sp. IT-7CA2]